MSIRPDPPGRLLAAVVGVGFSIGACTGASTPPPSGAPTPSVAVSPSAPTRPSPSLGSALVVKVTTEGGFINPAATIASLPVVAAYADGRILSPAPVAAIYPGPLVPPVTVRSVGPAGAAAIRAAVHDAGLDGSGGGDQASAGPGMPDAGTTVFTVVVDGRTVVTRFVGLAGGPPLPGQPSGAGDARTLARALLDRLTDPNEAWGSTSTTEAAYDPPGFLLYVAPGAPTPSDPSLTEPSIAWPLATPLAGFGAPAVPDRGIAGLRQGAVLGADAATAKPVLERATAISPFTSAGSTFTLYARPLLPDELPG
jgi:hypothetical protein